MQRTAQLRRSLVVLLAAVAASIASISAAQADCKLAKILEISLNPDAPRPLIPVQLNGQEEHFLIDSGALDSMVSSATAARMKLSTYYPANAGVRHRGSAEANHIEIARVKELKVAGLTIKDGELSVIDSVAGDGVLGQNVLQHFTVEYDFGGGVMRLFTSNDCGSATFAYWLGPEQQYSSMRIGIVEPSNPYTMGEAYINGYRVRVVFNSGWSRSIITRDAAARVGVNIKSEDKVDAGLATGTGMAPIKTYVGEFATFKIGDNETLRNVKIPIADVKLRFAEMLLGADFFAAHRIIVGNKEERLLMTYNGGAAFDTSPESRKGENSVPVQHPR